MSYLYAVRMLIPNQEQQPIKVGFSTVPLKRKMVYGSGPYKCEWLGYWPGTMRDELAFHMRFMELNKGLAGEWFLPNDEFMHVITRKIAAYKKTLDRREAKRETRATQRLAEQSQSTSTEAMRIRAGEAMQELAGGYGVH